MEGRKGRRQGRKGGASMASEVDSSDRQDLHPSAAMAGFSGKEEEHSSWWARLVSIKKVHPNIHIKDDEVIIGRANVEGDKRVSKSHCKIYRDPLSGLVNITNLSRNGTLINRQLIKAQEPTIIKEGDEIAFGPSNSVHPNYIFQIVETAQSNQKKRTRQVSEEGDRFKCSICLNIWHDVVSVAPCLHNFCNACFSEWYESCRNMRCRCPDCRAVVSSVSKNHILSNLVKDFLEDNPSLKRPEEDILRMNKIAIVHSKFLRINNADEFDDGLDDGLDETYEQSHYDAVDFQSDHCPQCPIYGTVGDGFRCNASTTHLTCSECYCLMPERSDLRVPQKCAGCNRVLCNAYWLSQTIPTRGIMFISCPESGPGTLKPMNEHNFLRIPSGTFRGNTFEQDVTRRYMSEKGLVLQDIVREWLIKLDSGEIEQPKNLESFGSAINSMSYVCNECADEVIQHLLFKFRLSVPKAELPPDVARREDCWYGYHCRTQRHKHLHAKNLNHVCEPTRTSRLTRSP